MEWMLIGITLVLLVATFISLLHIKKIKEQSYSMINEFVGHMEQEHDELYQKVVAYMKEKESELNEKIQTLEQQLTANEVSATAKETSTTDQITQMYKQGFSTNQIAKLLQVNRGEVEFVVTLYRKSKGIE